MEDIIKSIKAHLYDRIASPLSGALIISWCIWNYKVLFVLLSSESMPYKLNFIEIFYAQIFSFNAWNPDYPISNALANGIFGPISTACIYIFIYPAVSIPVYRFSLWVQKKYETAKNKHQQEKLLTLDQSMEFHKKLQELESQQQIEYKDYLARNDALNALINQRNTQFQDLEIQYKNLQAELETIKNPKTKPEHDSDSISKKNTTLENLNLIPDKSIPKKQINASIIEGKKSGSEPTFRNANTKKIRESTFIWTKLANKIYSFSPHAEFRISQLFDSEVWNDYNGAQRAAIADIFQERYNNGEYINIKLKETEDKSGENTYISLPFAEYSRWQEIKDRVIAFINSKKEEAFLYQMSKGLEIREEIIKSCVDYLIEKNFLKTSFHTVNGSKTPAFSLTSSGRFYAEALD